jgi:Aminoglycoside-2''-adenylyltransferase
MVGEHHTWEPLSVDEAIDVFREAPFRWWICGGRALEIHAGRAWRSHSDLDIGVTREQAPSVYGWLSDWDLFIASAGRLSEWDGRSLSAGRHENNVWARKPLGETWAFDLTIGSGTDERWVYRRDPSLSLLWDEAILCSSDGVPYLAPELQLLFKAKNHRLKDDHDAGQVIPTINLRAQRLLREHLPSGHDWQRLLGLPQ